MLPKRLAAPGFCLRVCEVQVCLSSNARTEQRRGLSANEGSGARVAVYRQAASGCHGWSLLAGRARELVKTASGVGLGREGLYSAEGSDVQYSAEEGSVQYSTATINAD
jgi:hypothetical protein